MPETVLQARLRRAWTQQQLADFAQVSLSSIQRAESGKPLRVDICQRICQCLGKQKPEDLGLQCIGEGQKGNSQSDTESENIVNRREASKTIASIGATLLTTSKLPDLIQMGAILHNEEVLSVCTAYMPIWWRLYFDGYHTEIRQVLPSHLLRLSTLADHPSRYQQLAAKLASQGYQLAYMLAIQKQDFCTALMHTKQASQYGVIAGDFDLQASAFIRQGYVYYLVNDPESMLYAYQKAFQYRDRVPPLLQGLTYAGLAKSHAFLKQEQEALHFIGLTSDIFPEHPEEEPVYIYTHWDNFTISNFEVVSYLQLNRPKNAWKACEKIVNMGALRTTKNAELLVQQAETSCSLGELKQSCDYVELAVTSALKLGSDLRYKEAYNVYNLMRKKWPREKPVKSLADLFN